MVDATFLYPLQVVTVKMHCAQCSEHNNYFVRDCAHEGAYSHLCGAIFDYHREICLCVIFIVP